MNTSEKSEYIEEIDWDDNVVAVHPREALRRRMFPHRVSLVIPRVRDGYLLARRGKFMHPFPDTWVCAIGGKVQAGESYADAARREALEEAGIAVEPVYIASFAYNGPHYQGIFRIFSSAEELDVAGMRPDLREVQYFRTFALDELRELLNSGGEHLAPTFAEALLAFVKAADVGK